MCIADWQLGRLIRAVPSEIAISGSAAVILPPNKDRVAITFACQDVKDTVIWPTFDNPNLVGIWLDDQATGGDSIIPVTYNLKRWLHITLKSWGDLPTREWNCICGAESGSIFVIEYILPERVLWLTPEQLAQENRHHV